MQCTLSICRLVLMLSMFVLGTMNTTITSASTLAALPFKQLETTQGVFDQQALKGKVVYIDFWASWCGPCRQSFPWMQSLYKKHQDKDFLLIAINVDKDPQAAQQFLKQFFVDFPISFNPDGSLPESFNVMGMPSAFLIDKRGNIRYRHVGFKKAEQNHYEAEIMELLNESI